MKICKMISLDTSSTISGYAYWENGHMVKSGVLDHSKQKDAVTRVENMSIDLISQLKTLNPDIVVVERPPYCNSPDTLIMLSEIVGCVKGWAISNDADYVEYAVSKWRKLVAGPNETIPTKRKEAKPWDIQKVKDIFNITAIDDNEADAILIGLARIAQFDQFKGTDDEQ